MRRIAPLCGLLVGACADGASTPEVERWDSAGIEIVAHGALAPREPLEVSGQPHLWIRGDERIPPFDRLSEVVILGNGNIVVADAGTGRVHAFSAEGAYLWSAGRPGEGPGEFREISAVFVTGEDTILVADARLARTTVLSPAGEVVRDHGFAPEYGAPTGLLASGALLYLDQERIGEPGVGVQPTLATWSAVDLAGAAGRTLVTTPGSESYYGQAEGRNVIIRPPFMRHVYAAPVDDGFLVSLSDQPRVDVYGPDGDLLRSMRLPESEVLVRITDARSVREDLLVNVPEDMHAIFRELLADMPIPPTWPAIGGLVVDDEDRVWVQQYRSEDEAGQIWHVFTLDGAYLDEVSTPGRFAPRAIRGDLVVGFWRDELDVESIRVYRILRR